MVFKTKKTMFDKDQLADFLIKIGIPSAVAISVKLGIQSKKEKMTINYINLIYRNCYEIHNFVLESTNLEIQFPRLGLIQEETIPTITQAEEKARAPLFLPTGEAGALYLMVPSPQTRK